MPKKQDVSVKTSTLTNNIGSELITQLRTLFDSTKKNDEFEFIFFSKKGKYLSQEKYIQLLKFFSKRSSNGTMKLLPPENTLDIIYPIDQNTTVRNTLSGTESINNIMKKLILLKNHVIFRTLVSMWNKGSKNINVMKKEKSLEQTIDIDELDIRARLSKESTPSSDETKQLMLIDETQMNKIKYRYKQRTSLFLYGNEESDDFIRIDLTYTKMADTFKKLNHAVPNYELEIEYGTKSSAKSECFDMMLSEIELLTKIIQQSNHIITRSMINNVIEYYKNLLSLPQNFVVTALDARQSITLEIQHVTELIPNRYTVTDKADGERHFLIICNNKVFFMSTNADVKYTGIELPESLNEYNGSVIDGELIFIPHKNRHLFMAFDCLFHKSKDIRQIVKLSERLSYADDIINKCFITSNQKGLLPPEKNIIEGTFHLEKRIDIHYSNIEKIISNLNHDLDIDKQYPLIRRKYFADATGAKDWEIFAYAVAVWNAFTNTSSVKCPYLLDGLIFQPLEQPYITSAIDSKNQDYKWKPPEKNSIDFYVEFDKDPNGKLLSVYDNSYDDYEFVRNKPYRICKLYVGQKNTGNEVPVLFKEEQQLYNAYIFLDNGEVRDVDGNILTDKTVIEFYYNNDPNVLEKFRWVPLRTRYDKTESVVRFGRKYGNYITVADKVWRSIINPLLISDFDDLSKGNDPAKNQYYYNKKIESLRKKIGHELIISATKENAYFQLRTNLAKHMRNFNNWIKSNQIYTFCHPMYQDNRQLSVLDISCGRGADIMKFYYSKSSLVVGLDIDREGLISAVDGAISRYNQLKAKKPNFPQMYFIQADATAEFDLESQKKSLGLPHLENEQHFVKFFSNDPKKRTLFDRINCQFALHYMLKNDESWKNFKKNVNNYLRNGGFMLLTLFDGLSVAKLLKDTEKYTYEYTDPSGKVKTLFEIVKKYQEPANDNVIFGTGNAIDVYMAWISQEGRYLTEYLVDSRFLTEQLEKECDLELIDTDSFGNQMIIHEPYVTFYSKYEDVDETRKFMGNVAEFYRPDSINEGCKKLNSLYRFYVFRKRDNPKKQIGGGDDLLNFSNSDKFIVPAMNGYDNEYSCINSIHHILKNHKIIPKSIKPKSLCNDIGIKFTKDTNIGNKLNDIGKKLVVSHLVTYNNEEIKKNILEGVHVFVVERDCNDDYDIDLIKKSQEINPSDKSVILMKEGTWYVPVYYLDDDKEQRTGLYNMDHHVIQELLKNIDDN